MTDGAVLERAQAGDRAAFDSMLMTLLAPA
jgi:hypothetical protein